jgi:energy-converting hydrogenase Eha subunit B
VKDYIPEGTRRILASVAQWGGWLGSFGVFAWATLTIDPGTAPRVKLLTVLVVIILVGVAVAGTTVRSRMRLSETIVHAFKVGMESVKHDK